MEDETEFKSLIKIEISRTKVLVITTALLVCYSRIALQAHFLSYVLAGIGIALFFYPFFYFIREFLI